MAINILDRNLLDSYGIGDGMLFFTQLAMQPQLYVDKVVFFIDEMGRDHVAEKMADVFNPSHKVTIKIEQLEKPEFGLAHFLETIQVAYMIDTLGTHDVSCHLFYAVKDAPSFPTHTDPVDLIILCIHGTKTMEIDGREIEIPPGAFVYIPANTPHRATNKFESIILSIGAELKNG